MTALADPSVHIAMVWGALHVFRTLARSPLVSAFLMAQVRGLLRAVAFRTAEFPSTRTFVYSEHGIVEAYRYVAFQVLQMLARTPDGKLSLASEPKLLARLTKELNMDALGRVFETVTLLWTLLCEKPDSEESERVRELVFHAPGLLAALLRTTTDSEFPPPENETVNVVKRLLSRLFARAFVGSRQKLGALEGAYEFDVGELLLADRVVIQAVHALCDAGGWGVAVDIISALVPQQLRRGRCWAALFCLTCWWAATGSRSRRARRSIASWRETATTPLRVAWRR